MRLAILKCFSFIPDKSMIKLQYRIKLHRKLDWLILEDLLKIAVV